MTEEIKPAELWAQITAMPRPSRIVDFPRKNKDGESVGQLRIWVLTQEEQMMCSSAAEATARKHIKEIPKSDELARGYNDMYSNAAAIELLYRACRQVDDVTRPLFPNTIALRQHLSIDEVGALLSTFYIVQAELGPNVSTMSEEEVEAWIKRLVDGGSAYPLGLLSWEARDQLTMRLASRLRSSLTDTSSPGSQPAEDEASEQAPQ